MSELSTLFEQILHSERNFKARIGRLKLLSSQIQQCRSELDAVKEEAHTLMGEVAVKSTRLADVEVTCKLLNVRRDILREQSSQLAESKKELSMELDTAKSQLASLRQTLLDDLTEFGQSYDLHGSGYAYREEQARRKLDLLREEILFLEAELKDMDSQKEEVVKLEQDLASVEEAIITEQGRESEVQATLDQQKAKIQQLEDDKKEFDSQSSKNSEFVRLQNELQSCRDCPEEALCKTLAKELEELQRQCYHKQMRRQLSLHGGQKGRPHSLASTTAKVGSNGHYNPYTHQHVPASTLSTHSTLRQGREAHTTSGKGRGQKQYLATGRHINADSTSRDGELVESTSLTDQHSPDTHFGDESMNIIGDEWLLMDDEQQSESGDDWMAELNESELASLDDALDSTITRTSGVPDIRSVPTRGRVGWGLPVEFDSPDLDLALSRRRPGQSIFKAPSRRQPQTRSSVPKSAKKVRFNY